jgi:hypothetical protein
MLRTLSIESILNKKYAHAKKDMTADRTVKYLTYLMSTKLKVEILEGHKWGVYTGDVIDELNKSGLNKLVPFLSRSLDDCSVQTFYLFNHWLKGTLGKNYIPSKPLIDVLSEVEVDIKASYFKEKFGGYFELSHAKIMPPHHWSSNHINNVMFEITSSSLIMSFQFNNDLVPTSFFVPLNKEENIREALLKYSFRELAEVEGRVGHIKKPMNEEDLETLRLIFNLIIYVSNPNEEFKEQFNRFSPNNRLAQKEKQTYTTRKYVLIGEDVEFLRLQKTEETNVRAFWRWQPVGVGREQRRLTFVRPHTRTYTKHFDG